MVKSSKMVFKKGDILMHQGALEGSAYIIESGNVEILLEKEGQLLQISTRGPGSIVGEMAMIDDRPRTATVRALDECHVIEVSRDDFTRHVDSADPIIKMIMRVIVTRYRDMVTRIEGFQVPAHFPTAQEVEKTDKFRDVAINAIKVQTELVEALNKNELLLFYQPIIDLRDMKIAGFEALMRWKHPEKGMISPGVFIPVAEESGLIVDLTKWALATSCDAVKELQKAANPDITTKEPLFVSVNFSVKDFASSDFFDHLESTLRSKGTDPKQIHLEITESLLMEAPEAAKGALEKCRQHGLVVAIDDFGTGYSSLSYLHYFPIDTLKIDQSFVRSMRQHPGSLALVKSIIGLARNLNMNVIAEGIETEDEAKLIRDLGCEQCQGYWFAKPLPFDDAVKFVQTWKSPL